MPLVKTNIGRNAGSVINVPVHSAEHGLANGTYSRPTEQEVMASGLAPKKFVTSDKPEEMPLGYRAMWLDDFPGMDVYRDGIDEPLNEMPIRTLAAARGFAEKHAEEYPARLVIEQENARRAAVHIEPGWRNYDPAMLVDLARQIDAGSIGDVEAIDTIHAEETRRRAIDDEPPLDRATGELPVEKPPEPPPQKTFGKSGKAKG
jgi:hypothetical protein